MKSLNQKNKQSKQKLCLFCKREHDNDKCSKSKGVEDKVLKTVKKF